MNLLSCVDKKVSKETSHALRNMIVRLTSQLPRRDDKALCFTWDRKGQVPALFGSCLKACISFLNGGWLHGIRRRRIINKSFSPWSPPG